MYGNNNLMMSSQVYTLIGNIDLLEINSSQKKKKRRIKLSLDFQCLNITESRKLYTT